MGEKKTLLLHSRMLHDPKTVIGNDFDQETAEKIAPPFILQLDLANCTTLRKKQQLSKQNILVIVIQSLNNSEFIYSK